MASLAGMTQAYASGAGAAERRKKEEESKQPNLLSAAINAIIGFATGGPPGAAIGAATGLATPTSTGAPGAATSALGTYGALKKPEPWDVAMQAGKAGYVPGMEGGEGVITGPAGKYWKAKANVPLIDFGNFPGGGTSPAAPTRPEGTPGETNSGRAATWKGGKWIYDDTGMAVPSSDSE